MTEATTPLRAIGRLLTFRLTRDEFMALDGRHLRVALLWTWIVGAGRWWDDADANILQHLGLGSLVYTLVLAGLLWCISWPFRSSDLGYRKVLTFVAMTSPPAVLYAVPVELLFDMDTASVLNLGFLALVAAWRVALLGLFFWRLAALRWLEAIASTLLPLAGIVASLTALNLHRVVFRLMGSIEESERSAHDAAYQFLIMLTVLSVYATPLVLALWTGCAARSWLDWRRKRQVSAPPRVDE